MTKSINFELDEILRNFREVCFEAKRRVYEDGKADIELVVLGVTKTREDIKTLIATSNVEARIDELRTMYAVADEISRDNGQAAIGEMSVEINDRIASLTHSKTTVKDWQPEDVLGNSEYQDWKNAKTPDKGGSDE